MTFQKELHIIFVYGSITINFNLKLKVSIVNLNVSFGWHFGHTCNWQSSSAPEQSSFQYTNQDGDQ